MVSDHSGGSAAAAPEAHQAAGAEPGPSTTPLGHARGGEVTVMVPTDVAERFNRAVDKTAATGGSAADSNQDSDTHKSGMEPLTDRARNLTEVTHEKVQSEGTSNTRAPEVGFPAR
ncbi:hypothetical protein ACK3TF_000995 [Chlorella vulgaris]